MKEIFKTFISLIILLLISALVYLAWIINKGEFSSKYLEKFIPGYSYRNQQGEYSEHIITSLNEKGHTYLEAPTGIGKTLGYL